MIEPTGYTALDLVGYTDKGNYAANVNYVKNDLVHYGGNIWRILIDDTIGITPAEGPNYTLFIGEPTNLVERIIAPLEDNPATVAYQTGRQIIYNDYLYEVIDDIAVGDTLITYEDDPTNANIKLASPVETQVLALNGRMDTAEDDIDALETGKADNSVIAPVESGTTASRAYAIGAHFIRDSAFCTAKTAIAQGEAFTLNTNYTVGMISSKMQSLESYKIVSLNDSGISLPSGISFFGMNCYVKTGRIVNLLINLQIVSSVKQQFVISNFISDIKDRPIIDTSNGIGNGSADGVVQNVTLKAAGSLEIWNVKTGTTYAQGNLVYIANDVD